jgi:hypothetical protein
LRPDGTRVGEVAALAVALLATLLAVSTSGAVFVPTAAVALDAPSWCHRSRRPAVDRPGGPHRQRPHRHLVVAVSEGRTLS